MALVNYMETYLKNTKPDITLLSEDKFEITVHKEIFFQTQLMRTMIRSTDTDYCCSRVSVICSIPREELEMIVQFLYSGEVFFENLKDANILSENLTGLFGFPKLCLSSKSEPKFEIASKSISKEEFFNMTNSSNRKKSRKQSMTSATIRNEFPEDLVTIKTESKCLFDETNLDDDNLSDPLDTNVKGGDAESEMVCNICNKRFISKRACLVHVFRKHRDVKGEVAENNVVCTICNKRFISKNSCATHVFRKHKDSCNVCLKQFESKQDLKDHITTAHILSDFQFRIRCVICDISFSKSDKGKLREHMKSEHNIGYKCSICHEELPSKLRLKQHIKEHNKVTHESYICSKCGKTFKIKSSLEYHVSKNCCYQMKGNKCSICNEKFESRSLKMDHFAIKHPDMKMYQCTKCSSRLISVKGLKIHMSTAHGNNVGSICPICGKILKTVPGLKEHISQVHEGNKPRFKCTLCDGSFSTKQALENHMSVHEGKIFQCSNCNEEFNSKNKLEGHIAKEHDRSKLHKCEHCDSAYVTKNALVSHIAFVHDKTISNVCSHCGKNCMSKGDLKNHVRIVHELAGKHLFKCEHCEKSFKLEHTLKSHIEIIHEGTRVNCPVCQKPFVSKTVMKLHIKTVHEKKKPHVCDICNESFAQTAHLKTHKKGKHKIIM